MRTHRSSRPALLVFAACLAPVLYASPAAGLLLDQEHVVDPGTGGANRDIGFRTFVHVAVAAPPPLPLLAAGLAWLGSSLWRPSRLAPVGSGSG